MKQEYPRALSTWFLLVRSNSKLSKIIARATRGRLEGATHATHIDRILFDGVVIGIDGNRIGARPYRRDLQPYLAEIEANGGEWCLISPIEEWSAAEKHEWRQRVQEVASRAKYSFAELGLQLVDHLIAKWKKQPLKDSIYLRRLGDLLPDRMICSTFGSRADVEMGKLPPELLYGSPDDLCDYFLSHLRAWDIAAHSPEFFRH